MFFDLTEREALVFSHLVTNYLQTAQPVGSQTVAQGLGQCHRGYSPATVRHIMADLETAGFLMHPHTSAGRVPTATGLRYYIDCLVETTPLTDEEQRAIASRYAETAPDIEAVIQETSRILARLSRYVGLVVAPVRNELLFRHIEFLRLSPRRLLGIFVTCEGVTQNRVIDVEREFTAADLERINTYCNSAFANLTLEEARCRARQECAAVQAAMQDMPQEAMRLSAVVLGTAQSADVVVDGEASLLGQPEFALAARAKLLLEALEEKKQLVELIERSIDNEGVQVFIGAESGVDAFSDCSVIVSPYRRGERILGTLGVIGPARMAYGRVIPIVQCAAEHVSRILNG